MSLALGIGIIAVAVVALAGAVISTAILIEVIKQMKNGDNKNSLGITKVIDLGDVVQVTYSNGMTYTYQKDDIPVAELKRLEEKSKGSVGNEANHDDKTGASEVTNTTKIDYKKVFFEQNPELKGQVVVHHGIEQLIPLFTYLK